MPNFSDIMEEMELSKRWSGRQSSSVASLTAFLPESVFFIDHSLRGREGPGFVKFGPENQRAASLILRARYKSQGQILETNVTLRKASLAENLGAKRKWLIGPSSQAAILFLHGGGTKSTGGHVAETLINHFHKHNISALSPDLPWHGEGPRVFMGNLDQEIMALADFAKKYIYPDVPLFVWGHSWGGSLAHRLMQMSGERERGFFHKNLKGLVISSPAIDPAPGQPLREKRLALARRRQNALSKKDQIPSAEKDFLRQMAADGKISPVGEFFAGLTIAQLNDIPPSNKGRSYMPALMLVGKGDQLVYLGFEDLFHSYYSRLENVEARYLAELPLLISKDKSEKEMTGHLLGDYVSEEDGQTPIHFKLGYDFISQLARLSKDSKTAKHIPQANSLLEILQLWANDLGFREWTKETEITGIFRTQIYTKIRSDMEEAKTLFKIELGKLLPKTKLIALIKDFMARQKELAFDLRDSNSGGGALLIEIQDKARAFEPFFMNDRIARELIFSFVEAHSLEEAYQAGGRLLKSPAFHSPVKELDNFAKKNLDKSLEDLKEKYSYISEEDIKRLRLNKKKKEELRLKLDELYVPAAEDYQKAGHLNFDEAEIKQRIAWIEENVEKRERLIEERKSLSAEISQLNHRLTGQRRQIYQYIAQIKALFEKARETPPPALREDYEQSFEELSRLFEFSQKLTDKLEEVSFSALESGGLSAGQLSEAFLPHREMIESFSGKYELFVNNRSKLRLKLIKLAQAGGLSRSLQEAAMALYSEAGLYKLMDSLSLQLAEREKKRTELNRQFARLIIDYNKWIPYGPLSRVESVPAADILNLQGLDESSLKKNEGMFQSLLTERRLAGSDIPPPLPK